LAAAFLWWPDGGDGSAKAASDDGARDPAGGYLLTIGDAERGKQRFVSKGCVVCHSVNGVGGRVGPALDLGKLQEAVDIFSLMARMWQGASTMIVLQEMQLGYQIGLSGEELADIVSFLSNRRAQEAFGEDDVPPEIRRWMMDDVFERLNPDIVPQ
jgi:mono/diheme cytochrome c family protein